MLPSKPSRTPFYPALDGLRAIAVAMVFGVHFWPRRLPFGWLGVQIFFVLSGFLITGILFDTRFDEHRFRNFYARRTLRIFPLYYGLLLALAATLLATHGVGPRRLWLWFVYLQNFWPFTLPGPLSDLLYTGHHRSFAAIGHLWSLAVEEQFYLLWPLCVFHIRSRRRLMVLCACLILSRLALAALWQTHLSASLLDNGITYRMLPTQCDAFLMGGQLALWLRGKPSRSVQQHAGLLGFLAVLLYAALLCLLHLKPGLVHQEDIFDYRSGFQAIFGIPLANLASVFLILAILQPSTWAYRLCHLPPLRSLGRVSYGLYLFHLPLLLLLTPSLQRLYVPLHLVGKVSGLDGILATLLTIACAYLSFHLYEKPFLLLKKRFASIPNAPHPRQRIASFHDVSAKLAQ